MLRLIKCADIVSTSSRVGIVHYKYLQRSLNYNDIIMHVVQFAKFFTFKM